MHQPPQSSLFPPVSRRAPEEAITSPRKPPGTATRAVHRGAKAVPLSPALLATVPSRQSSEAEPSSASLGESAALVVVTPRNASRSTALAQTARLPTDVALPDLAQRSDIGSRAGSTRGTTRSGPRYAPIEINASPLLSCWPSTTGGAQLTSTKSLYAQELEAILQRDCAPSLGWAKRGECLARVSRELKKAFPSFASVFSYFEGVVLEMSQAVTLATENVETELHNRTKALLDEKERFYRSALMDLLKEKRRVEKAAVEAVAEVDTLRRQRDEELNAVKLELVDAIRSLSQDDHESHHLRQLLSSVYRANSELREYVAELELQVKKAIADKDEPYIPPRYLHQQVTSDFIEASEAEMNRCRLSTQRALIDSAVTTRSALHAKADSAQAENVELKERLAEATEKLLELQKQLHHERFENEVLPAAVFYALRQDRIHSTDPQALLPRSLGGVTSPPVSQTPVSPSNSARPLSPSEVVNAQPPTIVLNPDGPDLLRPECYTPRPHVPFEVQSVLGVDVSGRTRNIVEAVCDIALRQQRTATESTLSLRRLQVISSWMEPSLVEHCATLAAKGSDVDTLPFLPTAQESEWAALPHFLRTNIAPHVANQAMSERDTAKLAREFLLEYETFANMAREMSSKMVAPKPVPLWERRKVNLLAVLDVSKADLTDHTVPVPRGYAVSAFVRAVAMRLNGGRSPTELDTTTLAYNLWHSIKRFRFAQPACEAFLLFVDGQLPLEAFTWGERLLTDLYESLTALDTTHSGAVGVKAVINMLLTAYQKDPGEVWREALLAVNKTAKVHRIPMSDKLQITTITSGENAATGASDLACFVRRDMVRRFETFYELIEVQLRRIVKESVAMKALCVVRVDDIMAIAAALDAKIAAGEVAAPIAKCNFKLTMENAVAKVARLNASAHLPAKPAITAPTPEELSPVALLSTAGGDDPSAPTVSPKLVAKKKKATGKAAAAKNQIAALLGEGNSNDQSLVEWFAFAAALRTTAPVVGALPSQPGLTMDSSALMMTVSTIAPQDMLPLPEASPLNRPPSYHQPAGPRPIPSVD